MRLAVVGAVFVLATLLLAVEERPTVADASLGDPTRSVRLDAAPAPTAPMPVTPASHPVATAAMPRLAVTMLSVPDPPPELIEVLPASPTPTAAPPPPTSTPAPPASAIEVDALTAQHFLPPDQAIAVRVRYCESRGQTTAKNPASTASGWYQIINGTWEHARGALAGMGVVVQPFEAGRFDPEQNTIVAAWLVYHGGGWEAHWRWSGSCWR